MADYAPEVYNKGNIIGYTGVLDNARKPPTVYFVFREQNGVQIGHITQYHNDPKNVGREKVRKCSAYAITNQECKFKDEDTGQSVTRFVSHECITNEQNPDIQGHELIASNMKKGVVLGKGFREIHPSRQPFILVNAGIFPILEKSITAFTELKKKYQST